MKSLRQTTTTLLLAATLFLQYCGENEEPKKTDPLIVSGISPLTGPVGTAVTISGSGFSMSLATNLVSLNGKTCEVTNATTTSLTVTIPADATNGKLTVKIGDQSAETPEFTVTTVPSGDACARDTNFGTDGIVKTIITGTEPGDNVFISNHTRQPDGKILVIADATLPGRPSVVIRYNTDGTIDNAWGNNGQVITEFGAGFEMSAAKRIDVTTDSKVVVVGEVKPTNGATHMMILRYLSNGTLDNTFSGDGKLNYSPATSDIKAAGLYGVESLADGKLLVAGHYFPDGGDGNHSLGFVARLLNDGSFDNTFDTDGKQEINFGDLKTANILTDLNVQPDGKIVVSGFSENTQSAMTVARLNSTGALDASFNSTGKQTTMIDNVVSRSYNNSVQTDGKIVLGGYTQNSSGGLACLVRYNTDGSLDTSFGNGGKLRDVLYSIITDFFIQADGKILACAGSYVARYTSSGVQDNSFCGGKYFMKYADQNASAQNIIVQPDKTLIVSGNYNTQDASGARLILSYVEKYMYEK